MRDKDLLGSTSATVRLSILYPRPENSPTTRASTPDSLSTRTEIVCLLIVSEGRATVTALVIRKPAEGPARGRRSRVGARIHRAGRTHTRTMPSSETGFSA